MKKDMKNYWRKEMKKLVVAVSLLIVTGCSNLPERSAQDWSMQTMRNQDIFMQNFRTFDSIDYQAAQQRMTTGR